MPFDINSLPNFNVQETSMGPIEIILMNESYFLYHNGIQWMSYSPSSNIEIKQMYSSYDLAYGDVLLTGLGFGILALWLCNKPSVNSVTVIENSPEVIEIFKKTNGLPDNLKIINDDARTFATDKKYDGIFLDHYELQTWDWRLRDMKEFCSRVKHDVFWAWSLEDAYLIKSHRMDVENLNTDDPNFISTKNQSLDWKVFAETFFPNEKSLLNITSEKLKEYIHCYYDKPTGYYDNPLLKESLAEFKTKNNSMGEL
jgi:hypothetical protein